MKLVGMHFMKLRTIKSETKVLENYSDPPEKW